MTNSSVTLVLSMKAEQVCQFGRRITAQLAQEISSQLSTRIEGTCIEHRFGKSSIKIYEKCGIVLRIETTSTTFRFSSIIARWNTGKGSQPARWLPSRRASTA